MKTRGERLLLKVEDTCYVEGHGLILAPGIPVESYRGSRRRTVLLQKPDGSTERHVVDIFFSVIAPAPSTWRLLCRIAEAEPTSVPAGTEVWLVDNGDSKRAD